MTSENLSDTLVGSLFLVFGLLLFSRTFLIFIRSHTVKAQILNVEPSTDPDVAGAASMKILSGRYRGKILEEETRNSVRKKWDLSSQHISIHELPR